MYSYIVETNKGRKEILDIKTNIQSLQIDILLVDLLQAWLLTSVMVSKSEQFYYFDCVFKIESCNNQE